MLNLYVDEEDRLCTLDPSGKVVYLAIEHGRLIPTPGPNDAEAVGVQPQTLWKRFTNG